MFKKSIVFMSAFCMFALAMLMGATTPTGATYPAPKVDEISESASPLDPRPYALLITVDGSITVTNRDDTTATIAVFAGQLIPIQPYKITDITSATVIGLYNAE
jgi:outer membrane receptor protein involved in Fe transport